VVGGGGGLVLLEGSETAWCVELWVSNQCSPVCSRAPRVYSSSSKRAGSLAISCDPGGRHGQRERTTSHVVGVAGLGKGASEAAGLGDKVLTSIHGVARVAQVCLRTHRAGERDVRPQRRPWKGFVAWRRSGPEWRRARPRPRPLAPPPRCRRTHRPPRRRLKPAAAAERLSRGR
jgi:hypothetical protein